MSAAILLTRLGLATLAFTLLAGLLMLARRPLRERLGAEAVYALWLLVPLGVALCCWPAHQRTVPAAVQAVHAASLPAAAAIPAAETPLAAFVLGAWLLGAAASALHLGRRQRRFTRSLGAMTRVDRDTWIGARSDAGPMLVGLLAPRIVLPADYAERYDAHELAAVLDHERLHRRRGDLWWNLLGAGLRCAFWFHPLAAAAQRCCLADQELACDSAVLRRRAHAPQTYANALLKTQMAAQLPLGCAMGAGSPLRERIVNLGRRPAPRRVRTLVALVLAGAAAAGSGLAWAASSEVVAAAAAADKPDYSIKMRVAIHGAQSAPRLLVRAREPFAVAGEHEGKTWRVAFRADPSGDNRVRLAGTISVDGKIVAAPVLVGALGENVRVQVGDDVAVTLVVHEMAY